MNREYCTLQRNLKDYRAMGYDVKVKLNARAEVLLAEVLRIEKLVEVDNTEVIDTEVELAEEYRMEGCQPLDYPVVTATTEELEALEVAYQAPESDWIESKAEVVVDLDNADTTYMVTTVANRKTNGRGDICKVELVDRESVCISESYQFDSYGDGAYIRNTDFAPACSLASKPKVEVEPYTEAMAAEDDELTAGVVVDEGSQYDGVDILAINYVYIYDTHNDVKELDWVTHSCKVGIHTSNRYGEAYNAPACSLVYSDVTNRAFGHDPEAVAEVRVVGGYSYYEGFIRRTATVTATMLTCDVCNYQQCELPVEQDLDWKAYLKAKEKYADVFKRLAGSEPYEVTFSHPLEYCATVSEWVEGVEGVPTGDHYPGQAVYPDWDETYTYESYLNSYCELTCDLPQPYIHPELGLVNGSSLTTVSYGCDQPYPYCDILDTDEYYVDAEGVVRTLDGDVEVVFDVPNADSGNSKCPLCHGTFEVYCGSEGYVECWECQPDDDDDEDDETNYYWGCNHDHQSCPCGRMTANDCAGECGVMKPVETMKMSETEFDMTLATHGFEAKPTVYSDHSQAMSGSYPVICCHDTSSKTAKVEVSKGVFETWVLKLTPPQDRDCIFDDRGSELYATRPRAWVELPENGKPRCARCDRLIGACQCDYEVTPAVKEAFKDTTASFRYTSREAPIVALINNTYGFLTSKLVTKTLRSAWFWSYASLCVLWAMVQLAWQGLTLAATVTYKAYKLATSPKAIALYDLVITQTLTILCNLTDYADERWRLVWGFLDAGIELVIGLLPKRQPDLVKVQYFLD